jgi:trimeric autotransporter adhesin
LGNTTGDGNTATGSGALRVNTTGASNTAIGVRALFINNADDNTATGYTALLNNTDGVSNTATGYQALLSNTTGSQNTAVGAGALASADDSINNVAVGFGALSDADGGDCIALGALAGSNVTTAFNVIAIGHGGLNVDDTTWIENIYGVTTQSGTTLPVVVSNQGQLGTASSSRRFKKEVKRMDGASEAVLALKPVTFQYKSDSTGTPQFGLIAEEVAEVNPNLVVRNEKGQIYAVRYDAVNAMLLNEFLKEHRKVDEQNGKLENQARKIQEQEITITQLKKEMETVVARLREHDSKIQKVRAQIEVNKPVPQIALSNP